MKIQHAIGLSILSIASMALPAYSADEERNGFARALSCGKAGVQIDTIPALPGKGVGGTDAFITASVPSQAARGAAGYVWTPSPKPLSLQDLERLELFLDENPKVLTDVFVCYELKGKNDPITRERLSGFTPSKVTEPDAHGFRTVTWDKTYFERHLRGELNEAQIHSIHVLASDLSVSLNRGPITVSFGRIAFVFKDRTVVPRVLSTIERRENNCSEENCR